MTAAETKRLNKLTRYTVHTLIHVTVPYKKSDPSKAETGNPYSFSRTVLNRKSPFEILKHKQKVANAANLRYKAESGWKQVLVTANLHGVIKKRCR
jgi:hypothetical protein